MFVVSLRGVHYRLLVVGLFERVVLILGIGDATAVWTNLVPRAFPFFMPQRRREKSWGRGWVWTGRGLGRVEKKTRARASTF